MRPIRFLLHLFSTLEGIAQDPEPVAKGRLCREYVRIHLRKLVLSTLLRRPIQRDRACGFRVDFFRYWSFVYLFEEIFLRREYAFETDNPSPFILDCGSNIGMSVLYFKHRYPGARVVAFEPDPTTFTILERNIAQNGLRDVELRNEAVTDRNGSVTLFTGSDAPGSLLMSTRKERLNGSPCEVKAVRLSSYLDRPVDFLKLDIEGTEEQVVRDLVAHGKLEMIGQMVIEYHHHIDRDRDALSWLLDVLESHGFGYQLGAFWWGAFPRRRFQDLLIYAYRKRPTDTNGAWGR